MQFLKVHTNKLCIEISMVSHSNLRSYSKKSIAVSLLAVNVILNFSKQEKQLRVFKSIESLFKIYLIAGLIQHIIFFISNAYSVPLTFIDRPYFNLNFKRVEWFILGSKQLRTIATLKTQRFNKTLKLLLRQHCLNPGIHHFREELCKKKNSNIPPLLPICFHRQLFVSVLREG